MLRWLPLLAACASTTPARHPTATATATATAVTHPVVTLSAVDLMTPDGKPTVLRAARGGRPAPTSPWATWCEARAGEPEPPARPPNRAGSVGAVVLAVAVGEPRAKVKEFVKVHQLSYPQLVDEQFHFADSVGQ